MCLLLRSAYPLPDVFARREVLAWGGEVDGKNRSDGERGFGATGQIGQTPERPTM